jgi:hypothetical protein
VIQFSFLFRWWSWYPWTTPILRLSYHSAVLVVAVPAVALEVPEELLQDVRGRDEVRVEDDGILGPGIHVLDGLLEGAPLETRPVLSVDELDGGAVGPLVQFLQDIDGLIPGVVGHHYLVVGIVDVYAGLNDPPGHVLLVVEGQLYRDEGLPGQTVLERAVEWVAIILSNLSAKRPR